MKSTRHTTVVPGERSEGRGPVERRRLRHGSLSRICGAPGMTGKEFAMSRNRPVAGNFEDLLHALS